jgi:hypothetical protein
MLSYAEVSLCVCVVLKYSDFFWTTLHSTVSCTLQLFVNKGIWMDLLVNSNIYDPLQWIYVILLIESMLLLIYRESQLAGFLEFVNQSVVYGDTRIWVMSSCISSPPLGQLYLHYNKKKYNKNGVEFK